MNRSCDSRLLYNARVYRDADDESPANAILVHGGEVRWIGSYDDAPRADETIDVEGASILPGLTDAHVHLFAIASARLQHDLSGAATLSAVLALTGRAAAAAPAGRWVQMAGFDENRLSDHRRLPSRAELDAASPDRPVVVRRFCGHVAIVNSAALRALDIPLDAADPNGGTFGRLPDGSLDGSAVESAAERVFAAIPPFPSADVQRALLGAMNACNGLGITAAVEAAVGFTNGFDAEYAIWQDLRRSSAVLPLRMGFMLQLAASEAADRGLRPFDGPDWQEDTLKFFSDGIIGARTAAVLEPYEDTGTTGQFMRPEAELERLLLQAASAGWRVAVHSVGDRSTAKILDVLEAMPPSDGGTDRRHRIEHFFCPPPGGFARMARLGALLVMQPGFLTRMRGSFMPAFGARADGLYPGRSAIDAGVAYVASSDAPTGYLSPWIGIADAIDRGAAGGGPVGPGEALTARQAVGAYIHGGAFAMKQERWRGRLQPEMAADLVVLDRDPMQVSPGEIRETRVLTTMLRGAIVHDSHGFTAGRDPALEGHPPAAVRAAR